MKKLVNKMISERQPVLTEEDYNDGNLKALHEHIENSTNQPTKPVYRMVQKHTGPTEVKVSKKSQEILTKIILDL